MEQMCTMCLDYKNYNQFYKSKSDMYASGIVPYCKECLNKQDLYDFKVFIDILQKIDVPYVKKIWDNVLEKYDTGLLGRYLKVIGMQYPDSNFKNSDLFERNIKSLQKINEKIDEKEVKLKKTQKVLDDIKKKKSQERRNNYNLEDIDIEELSEKWGYDYELNDYIAFEKKYNKLKESIPNKSKLHFESLMIYVRYAVKAEQAVARGEVDDAKKWGELAKNAAKSAKITPEQLTNADLSQGIDNFSSLVREVEKAVDIIPLLPSVIDKPKDKADLIIKLYIDYERDLHGLPIVEHKYIYDFYNNQITERMNEFPETYSFLNDERVEGDTPIKRVYNYIFNIVIPEKKKEDPDNKFYKNLEKWVMLVSYFRWYPDLFFDFIAPRRKDGSIKGVRLSLDQRVNLRAMARFKHMHGVFSRGTGKTFLNSMFAIHSAIFYPDIKISVSAQTKENSASLITSKFNEIINFYPLLSKEFYPSPISSIESKTNTVIKWKSGAILDNLVNNQSSKGQRRNKLIIEESAQINNSLFKDVLEPIANVPRNTIGDKVIASPVEMHGQIHFFTTSWFRGTSEFERCVKLFKDMINLKGVFILGASYELNLLAERGESKSSIMSKKDDNPTFFATNYESRWVGAGEGALISIEKVMDLRNISSPEIEKSKKQDNEYVISVDVARSTKSDNNQSSICILKLTRRKDDSIQNVSCVNIINYPSNKSFEDLSIEIKRIKHRFNAKCIVVDTNGLGIGLLEKLGVEQFDPITNESLGAFAPFNDDLDSAEKYAEEIVFSLKSQHINKDIIMNFQDYVVNKKLRLLQKKDVLNNGEVYSDNEMQESVAPYIQTDFLIDEIANLKLDITDGGTFKVSRMSRKIDKDRFYALAYGLYYIKKYEEYNTSQKDFNANAYFFYN